MNPNLISISDLNTALLANVMQRFSEYKGNVFYVDEATGVLQVRFDNRPAIKMRKGQKVEFEYNGFTIESTTAQSIVIKHGYGKISDANANVVATVNTTIAPSDTINNPGDVVAAAEATLLVAANANRKEVEICLPSDANNPVRIGNAGVTANSGSILEPGTSKTFAVEAALYVIRTVTDETVTVLELERP